MSSSPVSATRVTGWRKSDAEVAAFTFTESPNSYAERTGTPGERRRHRDRPVPRAPTASMDAAPALRPAAPARGEANRMSVRAAVGARAGGRAGGGNRLEPAPAPKLGTGHGEREYSYVNHTEFARMQAQPNEVIRIRYDSLDNLVAMGVIRAADRAAGTSTRFPGAPNARLMCPTRRNGAECHNGPEMSAADEPDEVLMGRYAYGDAAAFECLYRRHEMRTWRYIERNVGQSRDRGRAHARSLVCRGSPGAAISAFGAIHDLALHHRAQSDHRLGTDQAPTDQSRVARLTRRAPWPCSSRPTRAPGPSLQRWPASKRAPSRKPLPNFRSSSAMGF